jgi:hypothetical protein
MAKKVNTRAKTKSSSKSQRAQPAKAQRTRARGKKGSKKPTAFHKSSKTAGKKRGKPKVRMNKTTAAASSKPATGKKTAARASGKSIGTKARKKRAPSKSSPRGKKPTVKTIPKGKPVRITIAHKPPVNPPCAAYSGNNPYLFISYAHEDMKTVFNVIKRLNKSRYRVWYDEGIEPGNEWPEVIGKAIIHCSQFLVFMSSSATKSRNVRNEINLAFNEDKEILVVFLEPTRLSEGMKLQIGTVQFINKFENSEKEFSSKLIKVVDSKLRS